MTALSYFATAMFGLMAGFFYAFSVCVMPGLDQVDPAAAIEAMQGINRAVRNPVFFATFFLSPLVGAAAAIACARGGERSAAMFFAAAAAIYVVAAIIPTTLINVPLNNALAATDMLNPSEIWSAYSGQWTLSNHARTLAATVATVVAAMGVRRLG